MKNKLVDLNNYLFEAIERLNEDMDEATLTREIRRAGAIDRIAGQIVAVGNLALNATRAKYDVGEEHLPPLLGFNGEK